MNEAEIELMFRLDSSHWWHQAKYFFVENLNTNLFKKSRRLVVDFGCGTGGFLKKIQPTRPNSLGLDFSKKAIGLCLKRRLKAKKTNLDHKISLENDSVEEAFCLDTLEHLKNDGYLIKEIHRILKKNGHLTISVPAHPWLFSYWDRHLGHFRRYTKTGLEGVVKSAGFKITFSSHFFILTLPFLILFRVLNRSFSLAKSDFIILPKLLNNFVFSLCKLELKIAKLFPLPIGSTIILTAVKK
jgi:SAM-dependent methyltransferase